MWLYTNKQNVKGKHGIGFIRGPSLAYFKHQALFNLQFGDFFYTPVFTYMYLL